MSKHKINLIDPEKIINRTDEDNIVTEMSKTEFFKQLDKRGFSIEVLYDIGSNSRISGIQQNKFNVALIEVIEETGLELVEAIIYLEDIFVKFNKVLSMLDSKTKLLLKQKMAKRYNIEIEKNNLCDLLKG